MIQKTNLFIIILGVLLTGCFKTEVAPPLLFDGEANMTIAEFQTRHTLSVSDPITLIEEDIIITGVVTSTDEFGSSYKEIFFQDETGGLSIRISTNPYYAKYRIGQRIFVKAKDLYLGNYVSGQNYGFYQMGMYGNANGGMEYISAKAENQHIFRHDTPKPIEPKIITNQTDFELPRDYHTLVKLVNCRFDAAKEDGSAKYFESSGTSTTISRRIKFNEGTGNGVDARISAYCNFANAPLPYGTVNITGILTKFYDDTPQLIICSIKDVDINEVEYPKILKEYDMSTDPFSEGWTNKQIQGESVWSYSTGASNSVRIQPQAGEATECWLVSPKFNFTGEQNIDLSFSYRLTSGATDENIQVLYTVDGATWNQFTDFIQQTGTSNTTLKLEDSIASNPNFQIAFKYKTTDVFPTWMITNITFRTNGSI